MKHLGLAALSAAILFSQPTRAENLEIQISESVSSARELAAVLHRVSQGYTSEADGRTCSVNTSLVSVESAGAPHVARVNLWLGLAPDSDGTCYRDIVQLKRAHLETIAGVCIEGTCFTL